jgi:PadR family transcriptional regulator AphA
MHEAPGTDTGARGLPRLSGASLAILGMVGLRGPSTAYEIRRAVSRLSGEFWDVPHAMVYHETARLEREGLLQSTQEASGRRRRVYALTEAGRAAVRAWLAEPDRRGMAIRDEAQLQLLCAELDGAASVADLALAQVETYRARLARLAEVEERTAGLDRPETRLMPLKLGRRVYEAGLAFWSEVLAWAQSAPAEDGSRGPGSG